jgi:hypothetical protein
VDPKFRDPVVGTILRQISDDTGRAAAEGRFSEIPDRHLSRSPLELDGQGWKEAVEVLMVARVVMMQFPIGREDPRELEDDE